MVNWLGTYEPLWIHTNKNYQENLPKITLTNNYDFYRPANINYIAIELYRICNVILFICNTLRGNALFVAFPVPIIVILLTLNVLF